MNSKFACVYTRTPYSDHRAREAVDMILQVAMNIPAILVSDFLGMIHP